MKKLSIMMLVAACAFFCAQVNGAGFNVGFVNFKTCVEKSKQGQHEKDAFAGLEKQMRDALKKTALEIEEIEKKLTDQDYRDGLSPTAEEELEQKHEILSQDFSRYQDQFYQLLNQANYKMLQTMHDEVSIAAEKVREAKKLDLLFNEDSTFAHVASLDYTSAVIDQMDKQFALENVSKE